MIEYINNRIKKIYYIHVSPCKLNWHTLQAVLRGYTVIFHSFAALCSQYCAKYAIFTKITECICQN